MERLVLKLRALADGKALVSARMVVHLMERISELANQPFSLAKIDEHSLGGIKDLTPREREVLELISEGTPIKRLLIVSLLSAERPKITFTTS